MTETTLICVYHDQAPFIFKTQREIIGIDDLPLSYTGVTSAVLIMTGDGRVLKNRYGPTGQVVSI